MREFKGFAIVLIMFFSIGKSWSQLDTTVADTNHVVQFSGIITEGDSLYGVFGASIIQTRTNRGTNTNQIGYFNMPVNSGDTIMIVAMGYRTKYLVIPYDTSYSYNIVMQLDVDTIFQGSYTLHAFPSEKTFVNIVLAMDLEDEQYNNLNNNLDKRLLAYMYNTSSLDGAATHNYYMQQQIQNNDIGYQVVNQLSLTNPFAWARFIQDVKDYKDKKKEEDKEDKSNASY